MFVTKHFKEAAAYSRLHQNLQVLPCWPSSATSHLTNSMCHWAVDLPSWRRWLDQCIWIPLVHYTRSKPH